MHYDVKVMGTVDTVDGVDIREIRTFRITLTDGVTVYDWLDTIKRKDFNHFRPVFIESFR